MFPAATSTNYLGPMFYACENCNFSTEHAAEYKDHMIAYHCMVTFCCTLCSYFGIDRRSIGDHYLRAHCRRKTMAPPNFLPSLTAAGDSPVTTPSDPSLLDLSSSTPAVSESSSSSSSVNCNTSDKHAKSPAGSFPPISSMLTPSSSSSSAFVAPPTPSICGECCASLPSIADLRFHMVQAHRWIPCLLCPESFEAYPLLENHVRSKHRNNEPASHPSSRGNANCPPNKFAKNDTRHQQNYPLFNNQHFSVLDGTVKQPQLEMMTTPIKDGLPDSHSLPPPPPPFTPTGINAFQPFSFALPFLATTCDNINKPDLFSQFGAFQHFPSSNNCNKQADCLNVSMVNQGSKMMPGPSSSSSMPSTSNHHQQLSCNFCNKTDFANLTDLCNHLKSQHLPSIFNQQPTAAMFLPFSNLAAAATAVRLAAETQQQPLLASTATTSPHRQSNKRPSSPVLNENQLETGGFLGVKALSEPMIAGRLQQAPSFSSVNNNKQQTHSVNNLICEAGTSQVLADDDFCNNSNGQTAVQEMAVQCIAEMSHRGSRKSKEPYLCKLCNRMLSSAFSLLCHYRSHAGIKPYSCTVCHARFTQQNSLSYHMLIHKNLKPFTCAVCNRSYRNKQLYKKHMLLHNNGGDDVKTPDDADSGNEPQSMMSVDDASPRQPIVPSCSPSTSTYPTCTSAS